MRKCAALLRVDKGDVFFNRDERRVKVVISRDEQRRVLMACHSEPTSGHFGVTKTYKRIAERFYWKGMITDVRELVSNTSLFCSNLALDITSCTEHHR